MILPGEGTGEGCGLAVVSAVSLLVFCSSEKKPVENKFKTQFIAAVGLLLLNSVPSYCCPYSASSCLLREFLCLLW